MHHCQPWHNNEKVFIMTIENEEDFTNDNTDFEDIQEEMIAEDAIIDAEEEEAQAVEEDVSQEEAKAPSWVKNLRKQNRELQKKLKEYESNTSTVKAEIELPPKPRLSDFDYDDDAYENALDSWHNQKQKVENVKQTHKQKIEQQQAEFNAKIQEYNNNITKLNIDKSKFDEAEEIVKSIFDTQQQNIMVLYAKDPAKLVYALGRDEDLAEDLAKITDPVKFAVEIAKHEVKVNMKKTKPVPPAERKVNATANVSALSPDKKLEQLRAKAGSTGDYSELIKYKKSLKGK